MQSIRKTSDAAKNKEQINKSASKFVNNRPLKIHVNSSGKKSQFKGKHSFDYYKNYEDDIDADLLADEEDYYYQNNNIDPELDEYLYKTPAQKEAVRKKQEMLDKLNAERQKLQAKLSEKKEICLIDLQAKIASIKQDDSGFGFLDAEVIRIQGKLDKIFDLGARYPKELILTKSVEMASKLITHLPSRISRLASLEDNDIKRIEKNRSDEEYHLAFERKYQAENAFKTKYNNESENARLALAYSNAIDEAENLLVDIVRPLNGNESKIKLIVEGISDKETRKKIVGSFRTIETNLTESRLRWAVDNANGNNDLFLKFYYFAIKIKSEELFDKIKNLGESTSKPEEWVDWVDNLKVVRSETLVQLLNRLEAANSSQEDILEMPGKVPGRLVDLPQPNMGVDQLVQIFVRLANETPERKNPLNRPGEVATDAVKAVANKFKKKQDQKKILDLLQYEVFKTDKQSFVQITAKVDKDISFLDDLLLFAGHRDSLADLGNDWRGGHQVSRNFTVNGTNIVLTRGRLNYFKNRHFPTFFDFNNAKLKNTFFGREAEDEDLFKAIQSVLNGFGGDLANQQASPEDSFFVPGTGYKLYGPGGIQVGVEKYNGVLYVTHYQSETGRTLTDKRLAEIKNFFK